MTTERREFLRKVMVLARELYRTDLRSSHPRTFADALAGAWRWTKRAAQRATETAVWVRTVKANGGQLSPSLIRSPIRRSLAGQRHASAKDFSAAYTTARLGI
jgi:hypothetical protein